MGDQCVWYSTAFFLHGARWDSRTMGLLPLEFTDCLTDSPYFREKLHGHEKELEKTSQQIKGLIKELNNVISAAKSK